MRITATQIDQWADKPEAQGLLPVLVRRLINATSDSAELAIRGADSVNLTGWDGTVDTRAGSAWVTTGRSRWEMSCSSDVAGKARDDFRKRSDETDCGVAAGCDFVFVTARRWPGKQQWRDKAVAIGHWHSVRAYDADDLEAWLETAPAVALWFGEQLGLRGPGIESIGSYWDNWRGQTKSRLTIEAVGAGRQSFIEAFRDTLAKTPAVVVLEADSTEEAVAFVCAQLLSHGHADIAACITSAEGWRYIDANPHLRVLVAANAEVAASRAPRDGSILIVPVTTGDRPEYFSPKAAQAADAKRLVLRRPDADSFEKALVVLGEDEADARRLARSTGRSWSVYRRVRAANPAIAHPAWRKDPAARCLTAIVLVGGWNDAKAGDIACLEAITGRKYEELERELLRIARIDDSPVLRIGNVWKAKAPLELLHLFARELTRDELVRLFTTARAILAKPDPALELRPDQRWMAAIYGKVREESGIVIDSLVDSLAKLSVYAENNDDTRIASAVDELVGTLLEDADGDRWLSLSGVLRELAEASPDVFLRAAEGSLRRDNAPIRRLFGETKSDNVPFDRWWHTHLLWALEALAWSPRHFGRVADILAELLSSSLPGNMGNRPINCLISLFRPWWPQTTATAEQRLAALDCLIKTRNEVAWELLAALIPRDSNFAHANAKPHWRDDDSGAPGPSNAEGFGQYLSELGARIVAQAKGVATRIARLVESLDSFGGQYRDQIVGLVEAATSFADDDRELIRDALRKYLSWHYSSGRADATTDRLRPQFDALASASMAARHAWLFHTGWVDLPDGRADDYEATEKARERLRGEALQEVFAASGWAGFDELIRCAGMPGLVGRQIGHAGFPDADVVAWSLKRLADTGEAFHDPVLRGLALAMSIDRLAVWLAQACARLGAAGIAAVASAAPCTRATWSFVEQQVAEARELYWQGVRPGELIDDGADLEYLVDQLVQRGRQRTALQAIHVRLGKVDPARVLALLEAIAAGADGNGPMPDGWWVSEAMKAIERSGVASRRQLALLEFRYFRALEHSKDGTKNLYAEMLAAPELFIDCVCLVYRPHSQPRANEPVDEAVQAGATMGWHVLHDGRGVPGLIEDGEIDRARFDAWVTQVRKLAAECDRRTVTDVTLGAWLSSCPADPDGRWPCLPVRDLLEQPGSESVRSGFHTGVINNRGVHGRAIDAGGQQERELAARYRAFAARLQGSYPQTAALLNLIAKDYDAQAGWHDDDSALSQEGTC